ncbi:MAG: C25 family cysteine peptidase, partial [Candidatus Fermentibacteraceae bacterium]
NTGQAVLMAQRVIDYESSTGVFAWVQKLLWIASNDNYSISEGTHNYCIDTYATPRGYMSTKVYPHSGGTAAQAVTAINGGVSMITFSGHGSSTSWADMSFGSSDFNQLTNDGMFPGVLSHACNTGQYNVGTCWAETWTRTPGRGGLYFWGSWPSTYWGEDDIQERAEYEFFLGDDVHWPMGYMNGGLLAVFTYYSGGGRSKYYYEAYHLFGDPSVMTKTWPMTGIETDAEGAFLAPITVSVSNPVSGTVPVHLSGVDGPASLSVYDITGRLVSSPFQGNLNGQATITWNNQELGTGVYFLRLTQGGQMATAKVTLIR